MRPRARVALLVAITLGGILPISIYFTAQEAHGMVRFSSYAELEHFLLTRTSCSLAYGRYNQQLGLYGRLSPAGPVANWAAGASTTSSSVSATPSHSDTNNQVVGVDELDTVKSDGQYIYRVTNNTVVIVNAFPVTAAQFLSRISLVNQSIDGVFVDGSRLAIVSEAPKQSYANSLFCATGGPLYLRPSGGCTCSWTPPVQNTSISIYDVSNRSTPTLLNSVTINGTFVGARMIGDFAYLAATAPAIFNQSLPVTIVNGHAILTQATEIYHSDISDAAFSYTTVTSINVKQTSSAPTIETYLLGTSSTIYVSLTNIFLTQPTWDSREETVLHRISINGSNINYEATGTVPGHVLNQYSMDEYNGYFRIATSTQYSGDTGVYVLQDSLRIVGRLEGISPGETFHAARFIADKAYLVTFKRTDPLFVIGLQQPSNPSILGQLNVTGVSDYLQPYDNTHLIGIGKSAQDVAWENAALFMGLKISLFDVSNPQSPSDISDFTIGTRGTDSPALTDAKAVLFDQSLNLLVLPIEVYANSPSTGYSGPVSQGAYVFQVSPQNGLVLRGTISHIPSSSSGLYNSPYFVTRALYIGNVLYTISNAMIRMNSLADLSDLGSISLA